MEAGHSCESGSPICSLNVCRPFEGSTVHASGNISAPTPATPAPTTKPTLIRQTLTGNGDIDPTTPGYLTIRLDPLPTQRATAAIAELCNHLTATKTRYPGTDLILRYEIKTRT